MCPKSILLEKVKNRSEKRNHRERDTERGRERDGVREEEGETERLNVLLSHSPSSRQGPS